MLVNPILEVIGIVTIETGLRRLVADKNGLIVMFLSHTRNKRKQQDE